MTLHSILGGSRIKKKSSVKKAKPWTSSLPRTKSTSHLTKPSSSSFSSHHHHDDDRRDITPLTTLPDPFSPARNLPAAHAHSRARMFDPLPDRASGLSASKTATLLTLRDSLPPVASASHLRVLLPSPTAAERELAGLVQRRVARRVVVSLRGGIGELVVLSEDLEGLVSGCAVLEGRVREKFVAWLRGHPAMQVLEVGRDDAGIGLGRVDVDALVRAGFLTALNDGPRREEGVYARPAARHALVSLETVARAAAGSVAAVGGTGVIHGVGGSGRRGGGDQGTERFRLAIPGAGVFLKLVAGALGYLTELLERTQHRQMPESDLREKWDGGVAGDTAAVTAKKARGEFVGVLPGRTRKWKEFYGLAFDWILREAVGAGVVEVFETRSVGRGVRLVV